MVSINKTSAAGPQWHSRPRHSLRPLTVRGLILVALLCKFGSAFAEGFEDWTVPGARAVQDFSIDPSGRMLVVQSDRLGPDGRKQSALALHDILETSVSPQKITVDAPWLGHQGISIERVETDGLVLWSSMSGPHGRDAARFFWRRDGKLSSPSVFRLFPEEFSERDNSMPKVCSDGRHLIARARTAPRSQFIAVFDLQALIASGPSGSPAGRLALWPLPVEVIGAGVPLQGLTCTEASIFVLTGNARADDSKHVFELDFEGVVKSVKTGPWLTQGVDPKVERFYEPEGVHISVPGGRQSGQLDVGVMVGTGAAKRFMLVRLAN